MNKLLLNQIHLPLFELIFMNILFLVFLLLHALHSNTEIEIHFILFVLKGVYVYCKIFNIILQGLRVAQAAVTERWPLHISSSYAKILGDKLFRTWEFPRSGSKAKDGEKKRRGGETERW